jgi:hypothetical protein
MCNHCLEGKREDGSECRTCKGTAVYKRSHNGVVCRVCKGTGVYPKFRRVKTGKKEYQQCWDCRGQAMLDPPDNAAIPVSLELADDGTLVDTAEVEEVEQEA